MKEQNVSHVLMVIIIGLKVVESLVLNARNNMAEIVETLKLSENEELLMM